MIGASRVLALIPARSGSKGLPGKNTLPVNGKPLIAWTVEAARASRFVDRTVLSTDDETIEAIGVKWGCDVPFRRPAQLATDDATSIDVVLHAIDALPDFEIVILLQPTSPLRLARDIDAALEKMVAEAAPACVSVTGVEQHPYWMYRLADNGRVRALLDRQAAEITRRQELPPVYVLNGAIYIARIAWLRRAMAFVTDETIAYLMPPGRSLDIDSKADFEAFKASIEEGSHA